MERVAVKEEGGITKVSMEGEGDIESFMDRIGGGGRRREGERWDWRRRKWGEEEGEEGEKRSSTRKEQRYKEPP